MEICQYCKKNIEKEKLDTHELYCVSNFNTNNNNLIPCEICNNFIEFDKYNSHITRCSLYSNIFNAPRRIMRIPIPRSIPTPSLTPTSTPNSGSVPTSTPNSGHVLTSTPNSGPVPTSTYNPNNIQNMLYFLPIIPLDIPENNTNIESAESPESPLPPLPPNLLESQELPPLPPNLLESQELPNQLGVQDSLVSSLPEVPTFNPGNIDFIMNTLNNITGNDYESLSQLDNNNETQGCNIDEKSEKIECKEKENCVICYDEFNKMNKLKCGHLFCYECLEEWLKENKKCPICLIEL